MMVEVGDEEDMQGQQSGKSGTHGLRCFGLHMAPGVSEDNFEVARLWGTSFSSVLAAEASLRQK